MGKASLYDTVPRSVRDHVSELARGLEALAGSALRAVIVYGSAARGEFKQGTSDVDVVVVLEKADRALLERMGEKLAVARAVARVDAMIVVADEIPRAADVFPLFYDDIRGAHVVVHGSDPFSELVVSDAHRRLRIEQELREAQIRLHLGVAEARGDRKALGVLVHKKLRQLRFPLRALLELSGVECGYGLDVVLGKAGKLLKHDTSDLLRVDAHPDRAHDALAGLLARAIDAVDRLETSSGAKPGAGA
jgi:predicted nucleotidyltransferase